MDFISITGDVETTINSLKQLNITNELFNLGVNELEEVTKNIKVFGVPQENYKIDLTIARGLDYYTGTVYETFLNQYRELGSVCSGGRYENLAQYYTDKKLPGVGISIGLTRLFSKLSELQLLQRARQSIADIMVVPVSENELPEAVRIATDLRKQSIRTEVYMGNKKIKAKMKYADKLHIPYVIVLGEEEVQSKQIQVKDMQTGEMVSLEEWVKNR